MAKGSRLRFPTAPMFADVVSEAAVAPMKTPWSQEKASVTRGTTEDLLPPKMKMSIGTPSGLSQQSQMTGHWPAGAVKRAFECAASSRLEGVQSRPRQSMRCEGESSVIPSHHI